MRPHIRMSIRCLLRARGSIILVGRIIIIIGRITIMFCTTTTEVDMDRLLYRLDLDLGDLYRVLGALASMTELIRILISRNHSRRRNRKHNRILTTNTLQR